MHSLAFWQLWHHGGFGAITHPWSPSVAGVSEPLQGMGSLQQYSLRPQASAVPPRWMQVMGYALALRVAGVAALAVGVAAAAVGDALVGVQITVGDVVGGRIHRALGVAEAAGDPAAVDAAGVLLAHVAGVDLAALVVARVAGGLRQWPSSSQTWPVGQVESPVFRSKTQAALQVPELLLQMGVAAGQSASELHTVAVPQAPELGTHQVPVVSGW